MYQDVIARRNHNLAKYLHLPLRTVLPHPELLFGDKTASPLQGPQLRQDPLISDPQQPIAFAFARQHNIQRREQFPTIE